ncbi:MAG: histidine kinase [Calditrichaeota bacterium]|nr:histidine kinase [Calditrichota bacterium]
MYKSLKNIGATFLVWSFLGLLYSAHSYFYRLEIGQDVKWVEMLLIDAPHFVLWFFFMPLSMLVSKYFPFAKRHWFVPGAVHLVAALFISLSHSIVYSIFKIWIKYGSQELSQSNIFLTVFSSFDYSLLVYFIMLFVIQVLIYNKKLKAENEKSLQLKSALTQSQLDVLKSQLQPHFLFNTLNSISVLTKENPELANQAIHLLSDLLRYSLKHAQTQFVSVEAEVNFIKDYLAIEKIRFAERLTVEYNIDPQILHLNVPSLLLQPIIENAVKHGVTEMRGVGNIKLNAQKLDDRLVFEITDNGDATKKESLNEMDLGIGLKNTINRLNTLYGEKHQFKLTNTPGRGTIATISIPVGYNNEKIVEDE